MSNHDRFLAELAKAESRIQKCFGGQDHDWQEVIHHSNGESFRRCTYCEDSITICCYCDLHYDENGELR